jgi:hypothetical protein
MPQDDDKDTNGMHWPRDNAVALAEVSLYTRYHIVPPMQHTLGVATGVAVQDTIW